MSTKHLEWRSVRAIGSVLIVVATLAATSASGTAGTIWPTYHGDSARTGNDTTERPNFLPVASAWTASLDGAVYGQPLVFDGQIIAATENNSVYGLDPHDGHQLWHFNAGPPVRGVVAQAGCGDIDPLGITSTAVLDTGTDVVFVVAEIQDAMDVVHHQLIGLDASTGTPEFSVNADPPSNQQNPLHIQQRAGLALGNGRVYIGYGGLAGDCGAYHGWVVSTDEAGGNKVSLDVSPHAGLGAIWAPSGPAIDAQGNVYVATGNPNPVPSTGDYGESVLKLGPTLNVESAFTGSNANDDEDLGSDGPSLLPGNRLFQTGKQHQGYILNTNNLATPIATIPQVCSGVAAGGNAYSPVLNYIFVPCSSTPITAVNLNNNTIAWTNSVANGPPILAGGELWSMKWPQGTLVAINPVNGHTDEVVNVGDTVPHFASPSAALGLLLVGTDHGVTALGSTCVTRRTHGGYWTVAHDGGVFNFGGTPFCGSTGAIALNQPIVGMASPSGSGYWLVARDGGVFSFGDAVFHGSTGNVRLNAPIVGMASTPSGNGYWLVASDGGVFSFGDAVFHGSTGNVRLNAPIVGMASTPSGNGYWLVASDGGVFSFGDAVFHGSTGNVRLNAPIVGMASTPSGNGYWLVASDGGVFSFGDAVFHGSTGNVRLNAPIVGMASTPSGNGYWLVASDGGIFTFGDAAFHGSTGDVHLTAPVVGIARD